MGQRKGKREIQMREKGKAKKRERMMKNEELNIIFKNNYLSRCLL